MLKRGHTAEEKAEIREAADAAGVQYVIRERCRPCYEKILQQLYDLNPSERVESLDGWVLKSPRERFVLMGVVWSNEVMATRRVQVLNPVVRDRFFEKARKDESGD